VDVTILELPIEIPAFTSPSTGTSDSTRPGNRWLRGLFAAALRGGQTVEPPSGCLRKPTWRTADRWWIKRLRASCPAEIEAHFDMFDSTGRKPKPYRRGEVGKSMTGTLQGKHYSHGRGRGDRPAPHRWSSQTPARTSW